MPPAGREGHASSAYSHNRDKDPAAPPPRAARVCRLLSSLTPSPLAPASWLPRGRFLTGILVDRSSRAPYGFTTGYPVRKAIGQRNELADKGRPYCLGAAT